jgi:hypothetical protein
MPVVLDPVGRKNILNRAKCGGGTVKLQLTLAAGGFRALPKSMIEGEG